MKLLDETFRQGGFDFKQLQRKGMCALFEKSKPGHSRPTYEAVIIQVHPAQTIYGKEYPEREVMPSNEQWGVAGWTYPDLETAEIAFARLMGAAG